MLTSHQKAEKKIKNMSLEIAIKGTVKWEIMCNCVMDESLYITFICADTKQMPNTGEKKSYMEN